MRGRAIGLVLLLAGAGVIAFLLQTAGPPPPRPAGPTRLDKTPVRILDGLYYLGDYDVAALYLLDTRAGLVLVDAGWPHLHAGVIQAVRGLDLDPSRIAHVLLTHRHADHAMGAGEFFGPSGVRVYAGAADAERLEQGGTMEDFYSDRIAPPGFHMPRVRVDQRLVGGETLDFGDTRVRVIATPGHTAGSVCYYVERAGKHVLFSGDAVMSLAADSGTYSAYMDDRYGGDVAAFLESLRRLRELEVDVLLPGHPYMDKDAGLEPEPFIGRAAWKARVDAGIAELETLAARYREDAGPAVYALEAAAGLVLVDVGGPGAAQELVERLSAQGRALEEVRAVLVTSGSAWPLDGLGEVAYRTRAGVYGSEETIAARGGAGTVVRDGEELSFPPIQVRVRALPGYDPGELGFETRLAGKTVFFSGRVVLKRNRHVQQTLAPHDPQALAATLAGLRGLSPDLWLPAAPFQAQNANIYDHAWDLELDANLELVRGAR